MNAEYWKLSEELAEFREPIERDLTALIEGKIKYIQYCYSQGDRLTSAQLDRLKQDEELINKYSEYSELVSNQLETVFEKFSEACQQIETLTSESQKIKEFLGANPEINELTKKYDVLYLQSQELLHKHNQLELKFVNGVYKELKTLNESRI